MRASVAQRLSVAAIGLGGPPCLTAGPEYVVGQPGSVLPQRARGNLVGRGVIPHGRSRQAVLCTVRRVADLPAALHARGCLGRRIRQAGVVFLGDRQRGYSVAGGMVGGGVDSRSVVSCLGDIDCGHGITTERARIRGDRAVGCHTRASVLVGHDATSLARDRGGGVVGRVDDGCRNDRDGSVPGSHAGRRALHGIRLGGRCGSCPGPHQCRDCGRRAGRRCHDDRPTSGRGS